MAIIYNMIAFLSLFQNSSASSNWSTRKQSIICPVSVALNATSNGIFSYPTFNREVKLMQSPSPLTCTALSDYGPEEIQCLSTGGCPLSQLNTESFSKCASKNSYYNLCQVLTTLKEDCLHGETVRLIVFGGSVASGHSTCGCCGRSIPSSDCPFSDVISSRNYSDEDATMNYCSYAVKNQVNLDSEYCNWSAFLDRWLRSIAPQCRIRYQINTLFTHVIIILHPICVYDGNLAVITTSLIAECLPKSWRRRLSPHSAKITISAS